MQALELKIPPPLLYIICMLLMYVIRLLVPVCAVALPFSEWIVSGCVLAAGCFGLSGVYEFKKAKTTVHPVKMEGVTAIVDSGAYRFTRNPMYLGLLLLLFGFGYWQQNLLSLAVCVGFVVYMNRFQIKPEERFLKQEFGKAYSDYKARVRRWI